MRTKQHQPNMAAPIAGSRGIPFQERGRQNVALVEDEAHSLALNADPPHHGSKVLIEVLQRVPVARLHLSRITFIVVQQQYVSNQWIGDVYASQYHKYYYAGLKYHTPLHSNVNINGIWYQAPGSQLYHCSQSSFGGDISGDENCIQIFLEPAT